MTIKTKELQQAIATLLPVAKSVRPALTNVYFRNGRVEASNAELSISLKLDHDLNAAVSPTVLAKFLARVDGENTTIAEHGSGALLFKSGRQRVTLPTWSLEDAPSGFWPESAGTPSDNAYTPEGSVTDEEWASFVGVVKRALPFISPDAGRAALANIHFETLDGTLYAIATDGRRAVRWNTQTTLPDMDIHSAQLPALLSLSVRRWYQDDTTITFVTDEDARYTIRKRSDVYPNFEMIAPTESSKEGHNEITFPNIDDELANAANIGDSVTLKIQGETCTFTADSSLGVYAGEVGVKVRGDGEETTIILNPTYLRQVLTFSSTLWIHPSGLNPVFSFDGRNTVLLMPLRA